MSALDGILRPFGRESPPAGAVLAVRRAGAESVTVGGHRQLASLTGDRDLPMTASTAFDLASITKLFTTTALMQLVSAGTLGLDDRLERWVPSAGAAKGASIRQLLLHRAGLWEWWPLYFEASSAAAAFTYLDGMPLRYEPESGRHYSDLGFMMLGRVIEAATDEPLERAITRLVIEPLELGSTRYRHPFDGEVAAGSLGDSAEVTMVATGEPYPVPYAVADFVHWRTAVVRAEPNDGNAFHTLGGVSGHAGLFSTAADLITLADALGTGRDDLWSPTVAAEFFAPGPDAGQALGFRRYRTIVDGREVVVIGHSGYTGSVLGFVADEQLSIVLATNRLHTSGTPATTDRLWAMVLAAL